MKRYEVHVKVIYRVDAVSRSDAYFTIEEGAEFPVVPYDDNTYCNSISIMDVVQISPDPTTKEEL
jgi:hypothetical protein